jgi:hypothetical protein
MFHTPEIRPVTKSEICRRFGWTRYEFDRLAAAGMPVLEAAEGRQGTWRVDPDAVARWLAEREAREAARRRLARERHEARRREEAERARRAEERMRAAESGRVASFATMWLYGEARWRAMAARLPKSRGQDCYQSAAYVAFATEWPAECPSWWRLPPDALAAAVELLRGYVTGRAPARPPTEHLLPGVDYGAPWRWRTNAEDA